MAFLAPLMLLGLVALAIPITIHLIGSSRAKVVKFAALDFLLATKRRTARRLQLRERLLLLVRVLVCLAIPLALAKPFTSCNRSRPLVASGPQAAVIIVDDGFASGYRDDNGRILDQAVSRAKSVLTQLGPEAEVAVLRGSDGGAGVLELSRDHLRLRDRLDELAPSFRPADLSRALARAAQLLAGSNHEARTVFLISPLQRTSFTNSQPPWGDDGPNFVVIDLSGGKTRPNLAITRAEVGRDSGSGLRGIAVTAEIANFGTSPAVGVEVALRVSGQVVARGTVDLPPGERRIKRFEASLPEGERLADATVELPTDALAIDDKRFVRTKLPEQVRTLLVDGDPRTSRHEDELFYLRAALRPGDRGEGGVALTTITADEIDRVDLSEVDVVVLANVPALSAARAQALAEWVRGGGGLLVTGGDRVDPLAYQATMLNLLPQAMADSIDVTWGVPPAEQSGRALRLSKLETDHPIFAPFGANAPGLLSARFRKVLLLGPVTDTADRKVLARYSNGATALVEAPLGAGRRLLFTSTIDRDWTDFPIQPGYLPLMQSIIHYLARKAADRDRGEHLVAHDVVIPIGDLLRLEVRGPDDISTIFERDRLIGRRVVRTDHTDVPGLYRVLGADASSTMRPLDELAFAVNVDPRGSDLTPIDVAQLPKPGRGGAPGPSSTQHRVELWHAIAALLLLLLLIESVLSLR